MRRKPIAIVVTVVVLLVVAAAVFGAITLIKPNEEDKEKCRVYFYIKYVETAEDYFRWDGNILTDYYYYEAENPDFAEGLRMFLIPDYENPDFDPMVLYEDAKHYDEEYKKLRKSIEKDYIAVFITCIEFTVEPVEGKEYNKYNVK